MLDQRVALERPDLLNKTVGNWNTNLYNKNSGHNALPECSPLKFVGLNATGLNASNNEWNAVCYTFCYRATRMHNADYVVARCPSVCLSVRPSVTRRY